MTPFLEKLVSLVKETPQWQRLTQTFGSADYWVLVSAEYGFPRLSRFISFVDSVANRTDTKEIKTLSGYWDTIPEEDLKLQQEKLRPGNKQSPRNLKLEPLLVDLDGISMEEAQKSVGDWERRWICHEGHIRLVPFVWEPFKTKGEVWEALSNDSYRHLALPDKVVLQATRKPYSLGSLGSPVKAPSDISEQASKVVSTVDERNQRLAAALLAEEGETPEA